VKADDVAIEVRRQRDIAVVADRELVLHDLSAGLLGAFGLFGAIVADEVDDRPARPAGSALHPGERAGRPAGTPVHRKGPHVVEAVAGLWDFGKPPTEDRLVERLRALHVADIDLEPADGIHLVRHFPPPNISMPQPTL